MNDIVLKLGGKEYRAGPLTWGDLHELETRIRLERIRTARQAAQGMPMAERMEYLQRVTTAPVTAADLEAALATPDGLRFQITAAVKHHDPKFDDSILDNLTLEEMLEAAMLIQVASMEGQGGAAQPDPTTSGDSASGGQKRDG